MAPSMNIVSLNCKGLADKSKRKRLFKHLVKIKADVVLLQETHTTPATAATYKNEWSMFSSHHDSVWHSSNEDNANRSCGVAILVRSFLATPIIESLNDDKGRVLNTKTVIQNKLHQIINIYAPDNFKNRPHFFQNLNKHVFPDSTIILGGDFNMVEDPKMDRRGGLLTARQKYGLVDLDSFKQEFDLADAWRERNQHQREYTWFSPDRAVASRLDRFYLPPDIRNKYVSQQHFAVTWSDHAIVSLTFNPIPNEIRGQGYWKFNNSLLLEQEYKVMMREKLQSWIELIPAYPNIQKWWEDTKVYIKEASIAYSTTRNRKFLLRLNLTNKVINFESRSASPDIQRLTDAREHIQDLKNQRFEGAKIRSRDHSLVEGEKPTRYFYAREAQRKSSSTIKTLHKKVSEEETKILSEPGEVLEETQDFFQKIFTKQKLDLTLQDQLLTKVHRRLPQEVKENMDKVMDNEEILFSLKECSTNSSPGIDGLPYEFYLEFWDVIGDAFTTWAKHVHENGFLPSATQRLSLITLIHKKGAMENLDNWRPISLLCNDYKIISKVLSMRMKLAMPYIIHETQTCGVNGRQIFENLYLIRDIINHANLFNKPTYIISLDFQKAFDKVDRRFLQKTLQTFGFGPRYIKFIISSNSDSIARVQNNGFHSSDILLERGLKQGCQQSQQLYAVVNEVFACNVRQNKKIKGFQLPVTKDTTNDCKIKLTSFADDNTPILSSVSSIPHLYEEIDKYKRASGCNINNAKTKGICVGGARKPVTPYNIDWNPSEGVKILGVTFFSDMAQTTKVSWEDVIDGMEKKVASHSSRQLSFKGRRQLAHSKIVSKAVHLATVIEPPPWAIRRVNKLFFDFIYNNKTPQKISRDIMNLRIKHGGINAINFKYHCKSLQVKHLSNILDHTKKSLWLVLPRYYLGNLIGRHNPEWRFLMDNCYAKYSGTDPPLHFWVLIYFLQNHKTAFVGLKQVTTTLVYNIYLQHHKRSVVFKCENYWSTSLNVRLSWDFIWQTTYMSWDNSKIQDVHYKLLHNAHANGENLRQSNEREMGRGRYDIKCPRCHILETPVHVFFLCRSAAVVWNLFLYIFEDLFGRENITPQQIVFQLHRPADENKKRVIATILCTVLHEIWVGRCRHKFEEQYPSPQLTIARINSRIKVIYRANFRIRPNFETKFCVPNSFCDVTGNQLNFTLPSPVDVPAGSNCNAQPISGINFTRRKIIYLTSVSDGTDSSGYDTPKSPPRP